MTFGNPDFVAYAQPYGAHGHRVASTAELVPTLEAAFARRRARCRSADRLQREYPVLVDELGGRTGNVEAN